MELRESLRMLRSELGMTQAEFANAVNVGFTAASRWENKNIRPNRSSSIAILSIAKKNCVSPVCLNNLTQILLASRVNDKEEKKQLSKLKENLHLENRILLTDEIMRNMLDNIDIAVVGHRIYSNLPNESTIIYSNCKYAEIFGYSQEDFNQKNKENIYFSIPKESIQEYQKLVRKLLSNEIQINEFLLVIRGFRKDKTYIWLEVKGISLKQFSYGWDFYLSCRDVTSRIETERKYVEEIAIRNASLQSYFASIHLDLVTNIVFRQKDIEKVTGKEFLDQSADCVLNQLTESIHKNNRKTFSKMFNREYLTRSFAEGNLYNSIFCFNTISGRWMCYNYVLVKNPYTNNLEAMINFFDFHAQIVATKMMKLISDQNFDYIGIINNNNGMFESFYYSPTVYKFTVSGERDYQEVVEQKLESYAPVQLRETQKKAVSLEIIRKMLDESESYSTKLHLLDYTKNDFTANITYRYLDETKTSIIMVQYKKNLDCELIL